MCFLKTAYFERELMQNISSINVSTISAVGFNITDDYEN
jgi:hypothetical protein